MKNTQLFSYILISIFLFTACGNDEEDVIVKNKSVATAESVGLFGKVKSVETISYYIDSYLEPIKDLDKEMYSKSIDFYLPNNVLYAIEKYQINYTGLEPRLSEKYSYEYDANYRVIQNLREEYRYETDWATITSKYYYKQAITYDDVNHKATLISLRSENGVDYETYQKVICDLKPDGSLDQNVYEVYYPKVAKSEENFDIYSKFSRVILNKDAQNNWTESYLKKEYFESGEVVDSYIEYASYQTRTITYY